MNKKGISETAGFYFASAVEAGNEMRNSREGGKAMTINMGAVLFQLIMLGGLFVPVIGFFWGVHAWKKRTKQLERIERKLEEQR